jgi:ribosomal protein S18 acetylase RimI-like enzyme
MAIGIRSFTEKDLADVVKLLNETNKEAYQFSPCTDDGLRSWIEGAKLQVLVAEEDFKIVGSVSYVDGHWGEEIEWLAVPEGPNRRFVRKLLVAEIERYVKREVVFTAVDAGSPKIDDWAELGYKPESGLYHVLARLDCEKPLPKAPEGIIIRGLGSDEEKELVGAVNAGFGWERLKMGIVQQWKENCPPFTEEWIHVADSGGRIVSVVASRPDVNYNRNSGANRGYLGPATTLPEFRGKNLATILTRRAMNSLFEEGMTSVGLYTQEQNIASVTLLQKLGFDIGHHWKFMRKYLPPKNQPESSKKGLFGN